MARKITSLNNAYTRQQNASASEVPTRKLTRRHKMLCCLLVMILAVGFTKILTTHHELQKVQAQTVEKKTTLKQIKNEQKQLETQVKQLRNDDYLAKYIRYKYYYSKDGETIYSLPQDKNTGISTKNK